MFVAHAPAGYLLARGLRLRAPLWLGVVGSLFPDLDMLYFYLIDDCQHLHHSYWTHIPAFWAAVWLAGLVVTHGRAQQFRPWVHLFVSSVLLHLVLDTVCGGIRWLAPLSDHSFRLFTVEARHGWWVANFMLHWTALFELAIVVAAGAMARGQTVPVRIGVCPRPRRSARRLLLRESGVCPQRPAADPAEDGV